MTGFELPLLECWLTVRLLGALITLEALVITLALAVTIHWWQRDRTAIAAQLVADAGGGPSPASGSSSRRRPRPKHYPQRHKSREG